MQKALLTALVCIFILVPSSISASYLEPITSETLDFGTYYYDLESKTFSKSYMLKNVYFINTRKSIGGVDGDIRTIGVSNQYASNFPYNGKLYTTGSPFSVYTFNGYSADKSIHFPVYIRSGEGSFAQIKFDPKPQHVQHCVDSRDKSCNLGESGDSRDHKIYYQPIYCLITATESCIPSDGLVIKPKVDIIFRLPKPELSVNSLDFGVVEVGESVTKTFTLFNRSSNRDLNIIFPSNRDGFSSPSAGQSYTISDSQEFEITYTPTAVESNFATYGFTDRSGLINSFIDGQLLSLRGNGTRLIIEREFVPEELPIQGEVVKEDTQEESVGAGDSNEVVESNDVVEQEEVSPESESVNTTVKEQEVISKESKDVEIKSEEEGSVKSSNLFAMLVEPKRDRDMVSREKEVSNSNSNLLIFGAIGVTIVGIVSTIYGIKRFKKKF